MFIFLVLVSFSLFMDLKEVVYWDQEKGKYIRLIDYGIWLVLRFLEIQGIWKKFCNKQLSVQEKMIIGLGEEIIVERDFFLVRYICKER